LQNIWQTIFFRIVEHYNITANPFIYIFRYHPNLLTQEVANEKSWCANFQMDNPNCPEYIEVALRVCLLKNSAKKKNKLLFSKPQLFLILS